MRPDSGPVLEYLLDLQDRICTALETEDGTERFSEERREDERGLARPRVLSEGSVFEKAAVHLTHSRGSALPEAATARRPELSGAAFEAVSVSLITHPGNPYVPTSHMNVRFFIARPPDRDPVWWFGGGFDLTPYYGFEEDARHWHARARDACAAHGPDLYPRLKKACDDYFFLPHRGEARGIGGILFDDFDEGGFQAAFGLMQGVGNHYLEGYIPIVERRKATPFGERERDFQLWRRGRYVEFNLMYDRGTLYGVQSGRQIESVLASLPPLVRWRYNWQADPGTPEAELVETYLSARDWS